MHVIPLEDPPVTAADVRSMQVELARTNLIDFARLTAPSTFMFGVAQCSICDFVDRLIEGEFTRGQINLAPRAGKSELASIALPAYLIGKFTTRKIIHLTNNMDLTRQFAERLVALLQSEEYREIFPHVELLEVSAGRINFRDRRNPRGERGRYFVTSIKKATSGHGAHFLLVDDPLTEQEAHSKMIKDAMWIRWQGGFTTRVDPLWNRILVVGTRWARDDLFGRVIAQSFEDDRADTYEILKVPIRVDAELARKFNAIAMADPMFMVDLQRGKTKLLQANKSFSPERFSEEFIDKKKAELSAEQWASLYLQEPTPTQGIVFNKKMFVPLGKDMLREAKRKIGMSIMTVDLAMKTGENHDFSAFLHIGVMATENFRLGQGYIQQAIVLLDYWQDRIPAADVVKHVRKRYKEWEPNHVIIEDAASGIAAIQQLRRINFPVMGFNPRKLPKGKAAKEERANLAALMIANTPIYYDEKNAAIQALLGQVLEFPKSDHDDGVDCLVMAILHLKKNSDFDSAYDTYADEISALRDEIEEDDEDDDAAEAWEAYQRRPLLERSSSPYSMSPAQRAREAKRQARRDAPPQVNPFDGGIVFDDED